MGAPSFDSSSTVGVELPGRVPERAQRPLTTAVIPDACGHGPARPGHACHLRHARRGIAHEVDDELRERRVERVVRERQLLRGGEPDVDSGWRARAASTNGSDGSTADDGVRADAR